MPSPSSPMTRRKVGCMRAAQPSLSTVRAKTTFVFWRASRIARKSARS